MRRQFWRALGRTLHTALGATELAPQAPTWQPVRGRIPREITNSRRENACAE